MSGPLRIAFRNLRHGIGGFRIFLICIALGVSAITGINALSRALSDGLSSQGRNILGGDLSVSRMHRDLEPAERDIITASGQIARNANLRAMASAGDQASLVDLKAVDERYPLVGAMVINPVMPVQSALRKDGELFGALADPALLARLNIKTGDVIRIGLTSLFIRGEIISEPDRIGAGISFGPRLMISHDALAATALVSPGSLVRYSYRIVLPDGANDDNAVRQNVNDLGRALADGGFDIRNRMAASPQLERNIERFTQFLAIVGLTALVVGGAGVANAVNAHLDRRRDSFATLKTLGATGGTVFLIALTEVMLLAAIGTVIGLGIGSAIPFIVASLAGAVLPVQLDPHIAPDLLLIGAIYGLLTALAFSLWPLARVHDLPVAALFRDTVAGQSQRPRPRYLLALGASLAGLMTAVLVTSYSMRIAAFALLGMAGTFVLMRIVAMGVMSAAKRVPRIGNAITRLAIGNIHRPGALTPTLMLSLGLSIGLLVTIALVDANLRQQLTRSLPERAPSFFFVDIAARDLDKFSGFVTSEAEGGKLDRVPMLRGRITQVKDVKAKDVKAAEDAAWVLDGDRGITFSETIPSGSTILEGEWWPSDYQGEPLVSMESDIAKGLDLKIGDRITVNVLGRTITARVANIRKVEWQSLGINFVLVFSPNTFAGAPSTWLATLTLPDASNVESETKLLAASAKQFPAVTAIRVKEALETVNELVGQLMIAIRGAAGITIFASILVLAGALGSGQRMRIRDAVILKTLGATRQKLIAALTIEYGLISAIASFFGLFAGSLAAFFIVERAMRMEFHFFPFETGFTILIAVVGTILIGLLGTWSVLGEKPARHLRAE